MATTWILHTETKGTGAQMVPLESVTKRSGGPEPTFGVRKARRARPQESPEARAPRRFKIVDLMTRQALVEGVNGRDAVDALRDVCSVVDVNIFMWDEARERWRLLTLADKRAMFDLSR
jgi:hypothetical protein